MGRRSLKTLLLMLVFLSGMACTSFAGQTIYVDANAPGPTHDGSSWAAAFKYLQDALDVAQDGNDIWVAQGIYKPDANSADPSSGNQEATFQLISGVALYGGFAGGETSLDERDWQSHETILSGNINTPDSNSDNSYRVVTGSGTDPNAVLDGFTITFGNANGSYPYDHGGGMYNDSASPTVANCTFRDNQAAYEGGGMYNDSASPTVTNCTFSSNSASNEGGGMCNYNSSDPTLTSCTFSGNSAYDGGGIYNYDSSPKVTNCTFSGNSATDWGGGMHNYDTSSPTLTNCTFSGNSAYDGGGMFSWYNSNHTVTSCTFTGNSAGHNGGGAYSSSDSSATMTNCIFSGNSADDYGAGMYYQDSSPTVTNCMFSDNEAAYGGGMCSSSSSPVLANCTFSGNSADQGGAMYNGYSSTFTMNNCILWADTASDGNEIALRYSSTMDVNYCDIGGGQPDVDVGSGCTLYWGVYNIDVDPDFTDPNGLDGTVGTEDDNLRLLEGSPCVDAGDNTAVPADSADLDNDDNIAEPTPFDLDGHPRFVDGDCNDTIVVDIGAYENGGCRGAVIFVDAGAPKWGNGSNWDYAYNYLQDALAVAQDGNDIWVAQGIYKPDANNCRPTGSGERQAAFQLISGVALYGGFAGGETSLEQRDWITYETILSGDINTPDVNTDNSYHVVTASGTDANAALDGFTITAGNANHASDPNYYYGGGMYNNNAGPTVTNCIFRGSSADFGGGVANYNFSDPTLTNCILSGNCASSSGGGMANDDSSPVLANCTLSGNSAKDYYAGGIYNNDSDPNVTNCILWANTAPTGPEIYNNGTSSPMVTYCDVQGSHPGTGNINADPCFVDANGSDGIIGTEDDNLRLLDGSPCIDAGDNTTVPPDTTDLDNDGNTAEPTPWDLDGILRFIDGDSNGTTVVDMGAYEATVPADFDIDGDVDWFDLDNLIDYWLADYCNVGNNWCDGADLDGDGLVFLTDYALLAGSWAPEPYVP